jgi:prepilin-type N-terminal cleavage/methylation domain-containing protein
MKKKAIPNGFSLLELIIVIALIAIMAAVAVPGWQKYRDNSNLKTAARELMGDIFNAKQRAVEENKDGYRLGFSIVNNNYGLSHTDPDTGVTVTLWTKSLAGFGNGIHIDNVTFNGSVVSFNKRGTSSQGSVVLGTGLGSASTITTNLTGRAHVSFDMH